MTQFVGIDLSLQSTGLAMFYPHDTDADVYTHLVKSKPRATGPVVEKRGKLVRSETYLDKLTRFQTITADVTAWVAGGAHVFLEGPSYGSAGQATHDIAGNWWHLFHRLESYAGSLTVISPSTVKQYATGKGNVAKDHVMAAVIKRYPDIDVINNDVADATALLALGLRLHGLPLEDELPATHLRALDKLAVPVP
jgi:Holliday junction resolvasome RuvABC endonuclease subunit